MAFRLPKLKYGYDALEPYIDRITVNLHYSKHHATYLKKFNSAIEGTGLENKTLEDIFGEISNHSSIVRNNGGGYFNHIIYWEVMGPSTGKKPSGELVDEITKYFGSFNSFKEEFSDTAKKHFGSGWAWLIKKPTGELVITSTPNQDNPLMDIAPIKGKPILALDVWEHAYYLKYQNKRPEYIDAFWNVVNWEAVEQLYTEDSLVVEPEEIME